MQTQPWHTRAAALASASPTPPQKPRVEIHFLVHGVTVIVVGTCLAYRGHRLDRRFGTKHLLGLLSDVPFRPNVKQPGLDELLPLLLEGRRRTER